MTMESSNCHAVLIALLILHHLTTYTGTCQASRLTPINTNNYTDYIKNSCNTTLYPQLCYKLLLKYTDKIQAHPKFLANTSIYVTFLAAKSTSVAMKNMSKSWSLSPGEAAALHDCMEETSDSIYEFQKSMKEMDHIGEGSNFELEMSNIQTWVSAALTDYDTCMDGFSGMKEGNVKSEVRKYIVNVSHLTSIALAFINNYAVVG